jgi:hypothetical protein
LHRIYLYLKEREPIMNQDGEPKRKPDPAKMQALRNLPLEIKQSLTKEEADAFLYEETWPDSLLEKLKDYLADEDKG